MKNSKAINIKRIGTAALSLLTSAM